jgi:hypothetical protein
VLLLGPLEVGDKLHNLRVRRKNIDDRGRVEQAWGGNKDMGGALERNSLGPR